MPRHWLDCDAVLLQGDSDLERDCLVVSCVDGLVVVAVALDHT